MSSKPFVSWLAIVLCAASCDRGLSEPKPVVRVALSRNLVVSGVWEAVAKGFTQQSGQTVEVVLAGEREDAAKALSDGRADLICIHDSGQDLAASLVKQGAARQARPWISSELVIIGPHEDPAKVRGLKDGGEALRRIVATHASLLDCHGAGSRETLQKLWQSAGVEPDAGRLIEVERGTDKAATLGIAAEHGAYVVTGRSPGLPALLAALPGKLALLVEGDAQMRRIFYVLDGKTAQPRARALVDYLVSHEALDLVKGFKSERTEGQALFAPAPGL